jgi:PAS domain S-box-containing protein
MLSRRDRQLTNGPDPRIDDAFRLLVWGVKEYAIFMLDTTGVIVSWNEGAERIKGYREDEILGKHFSVFYEPSDIEAGKPDWELLVAQRDGHCEDEGWRLRKDGTRFWASVIITALRDKSGVLCGFGKVTRDITDRKLAGERMAEQQRREAEKLRDYADRLSQLEKTKTEFLNVASHELRGPIAVLRGYLSMVEDRTITPDELDRVLPVMSGKLQQMELLVQQMLETARLDASRFELNTELVDVCSLTERVARDTHSVTLSRPDEPIVVRGDPRRLETALANLLDNAIKYSPQGGPVRCLVAHMRGRVFLSVEDAGLGIADEAKGRLFTRFGRIVTSENAHIDGTGLGLYLAREIACRHGGDVLVESREGHGSRFTLTLPIDTARRERRTRQPLGQPGMAPGASLRLEPGRPPPGRRAV